jgi:hypothetical protein
MYNVGSHVLEIEEVKIPEEVVPSQESEVCNHASVANVSLFSAQH